MNLIIENLIGLLKEVWYLFNTMSPYLLLGFLMAGILYILIPGELIYKHFSSNSLSGVTKASLFGVPLPLCSCGIIPVAAYLRKEGAGKPSTLAFLTSTPTTGIDSILATYSLLGPLFAIIRPISSLISGIIAGVIHIFLEPEKTEKLSDSLPIPDSKDNITYTNSFKNNIKKIIHYGFFEIIQETWKWLAIGILIGGIVAFFIPADIAEKYLSNSWIAYPLMLIISTPFYVCATGSIPITAALILKGLTPGAGFIFLFAGPATNTATLSFVGGKLGRKSLFIYLLTIILSAFFFGLLIDFIWYSSGKDLHLITGGMEMIPGWIKLTSSLILILLIINVILPRKSKTDPEDDNKIIIIVNGMSCSHCVDTIESSLKKLENVQDIKINLQNKEVIVTGPVSEKQAANSIKNAGYSVNMITTGRRKTQR